MSRPLLVGFFVISLVVRLWFNFVFPHVNNSGTADGSEYLRNAEALRQFFSHPNSDLSLLSGFSQSGPVFALFILGCAQIAGIFGNFPALVPPVVGQCLLASAGDVCLCLTANLLWGRPAALACAVIVIFYPPLIINTERLYTESFATSLVSFILYSLSRSFAGEKRGAAQLFILGVSLSALHLTRSVMILLSALSIPLVYFQERKAGAARRVVWMILGMSLVVIPWLFAQKAIFNKTSLVVDRVGNYNLFIGTNPDISGWLSYPYPDGTGIEKGSALSIVSDNVRRSPSRFARLMLDKPYRLSKFPWNDFRTSIGPIDFHLQVIYHQLLLLLCAAGIGIAFFRNTDGTAVQQGIFRGRLLLLLYFAAHAIYWLFITVPRYNMTACPVLILFAAAGAVSIFSLARTHLFKGAILLNAFFLLFLCARLHEISTLYGLIGNLQLSLLVLCVLKGLSAALFFILLFKLFPSPLEYRKVSLAVRLLLSCMAAFLVMYPARANGRAFEWEAILNKKGDKAVQRIELTTGDVAAFKDKSIYLLVDTEGARAFVENSRTRVNDEDLVGPVIPGISLTQDFSAEKQMSKGRIYFECEWIYDCMTQGAGIGSADIRQWFLIPVPPKAVQKIRASGIAIIEIENTIGANSFKIFGSYLPSKNAALFPSIYSSSWEKAFYGVESDRGFTDSRYDVKLDLTRHKAASFGKDARDLSSSPGLQNGTFNLLLTAAGDFPNIQPPTLSEPLPNRVSVPAAAKLSFSSAISSNSPLPADQVWLIRLKGRSFAGQANVQVEPAVNIQLIDKSGKTLSYPCRWLPRALPNEKRPTRFDYCFPMKPSLLEEKISAVEILLQRTDNNSAAGAPLEIDEFSLEIIPISQNPVGGQNCFY